MRTATLISTLTKTSYPLQRLFEYADNGESLEVCLDFNKNSKIKKSPNFWERYSDFFHYLKIKPEFSLGEGNTPLLQSDYLSQLTGLANLYIKNESQNPTWSFKDRGSLTCIAFAKGLNEKYIATISTGNMGHSISAYAARAGLNAIIFIPAFTPHEKIIPMLMHNAKVIKIQTIDYDEMKKELLSRSNDWGLRIVSGNNPIRVEGYKSTAFELFEQLDGEIPDYIAIPTSTGGHLRGVFKGFRELYDTGIIKQLPRMIIVQAKNNSPIISAIKRKKKHIIPFKNFHTIAEAITTGNPMGADEIIQKAYQYDWLGEWVSESEIRWAQFEFAKAGYYLEPAAAISLPAIQNLRKSGRIKNKDKVILLLTGSGLKELFLPDKILSNIYNIQLKSLPRLLNQLITSLN